MSFANSDVMRAFGNWIMPLVGRAPYSKKVVDDSANDMLKAMSGMDKHLLTRTFLVGERITLADIFVAALCIPGFEYFFDKKWRQENPNITRWAETIYNQPLFTAVAKAPVFVAERMKNQAPKKDTPAKDEKKAAKPAAKPKAKEADDEEEEDDKPAPKPKHPLEALPKPTFPLDEMKRQYSNSETREVALPWFWENYKGDEYSLWRCDYNYNDELTHVFMSANLIGILAPALRSSL